MIFLFLFLFFSLSSIDTVSFHRDIFRPNLSSNSRIKFESFDESCISNYAVQ